MNMLQAFFMVSGYAIAAYFAFFHRSETERHQRQDIEGLNDAIKRIKCGAEYHEGFFKCFCEGGEAVTNGAKDRGENPYELGTLQHDGWDAGYRAERYHHLYYELHSVPTEIDDECDE